MALARYHKAHSETAAATAAAAAAAAAWTFWGRACA